MKDRESSNSHGLSDKSPQGEGSSALAIPIGSAVLSDAARGRKSRPWWQRIWTGFIVRKPMGAFGAFLVLVFIMAALFAPFLTPYNPEKNNMIELLLGMSFRHPFGTDYLGRDVLARIIWGSRISLTVGFAAVAIGTTLATILGSITGYFGGKLDTIAQRFVDAWMCFPSLIILLTIMGILGPGLPNVILALGISMIAGNSRVVRSAVLAVKESQYIEAARSIGCSHFRILSRHILPNIFAPVIVVATIGLGAAILAEASLSFLGYGVPPPKPTWGGMLSGNARTYMYQAPWVAIFPGLAISAVVYGFNMLGDALRDILDPRLRGGR